CAIPAFEGLLPELHNTNILDLLFELATWHGLAKLKMHTESTLQDLDNSLTRLGDDLRRFKRVTCTVYTTRELPAEVAARGRRTAALASHQKPSAKELAQEPSAKRTPRLREFNLSTVKLHGLGHYVDSIRRHGTTDNYSTQVVSFATIYNFV
ncbi:hypothetical protein C0991_001010, partial [Blastosporella zonata]